MFISILVDLVLIVIGTIIISIIIAKFIGKGLVYKLWLNIFPAIAVSNVATDISYQLGGIKNIPALIICVIAIIASIAASLLMFNKIMGKRIESSILILKNASEELNSGSASIAAASQSLAQGASEQAASLEQTSSSLEEITAMTRNNAANMKTASSISQDTNKSTAETVQAILTMQEYMRIIKESVNESSKIMKTIDEIAFQTNLLALNAAVEAARAGEAGRGFAVVAEEVRSLARKSAEAAKTTGELMEKSVSSVETGVNVAGEINKSISELSGKVTKVNNLVTDSATASEEQSHGIEQINRAVSEMEKVTGSNSANAEETAASSEELAAQSSELEKAVSALTWIIS